ncbi:MAG: orotidine-5'-phosphate decarboxylase [Pelagibacteraceae bacterium TMED216]|nr:MAG: orotidine-5'-phosphate decarboxylase [Pelagibacteraceae bacterium TMED216]|tara:strand:- start:32 stop:721 length:690 start_codon:yes stop_codon:yes gene_type:complete
MKYIFIALDVDNIKKAKKIVKDCKSSSLPIAFKIGLQLFYSKGGREFTKSLSKKFKVFLDLKLSDIPNTSGSALRSLRDIKNINYLTVQINAGKNTLQAVMAEAKKFNHKINILGVTLLTSLDKRAIKEIGHTKNINQIITQKVKLAKKVKLDGIICGGGEVNLVKKYFSGKIIVPGIRLRGDSKSDQKRVYGPKEMLLNKNCYGIVIGRSIIRGNIKNNLKKLKHQLK